MSRVHPYASKLATTVNRRRNRLLTIPCRTLLQGFGYRRRTKAIIDDVHACLRACGLTVDMSLASPVSLDDKVIVEAIGGAVHPADFLESQQSHPPHDLSDLAQMALAATVEVLTDGTSGSGFIVHPDGLVVTGRHVVNEGSLSLRTVKVRLADDRIFDGTIFRSHAKLDFALIWIIADGPFPVLPIGNPQSLRPAQAVLAIGAPVGLRKTVTQGIVSNPKQDFNHLECIQTDAAINHGNSGGPLIDQHGAVGINLWGIEDTPGAGFALPIDYLSVDIMQAVKLGREQCLKATYCPACGYTDLAEPTWYCRNCGVQFDQAEEDNKS